MKRCSRCKLKKPVSAYGKSSRAKDKLNHRCTECNRANSKQLYEAEHGTEEQRRAAQQKLLEYIRQLRKQGKTLKEIAADTGLDLSTISYYLSGKRNVGTQAVKKWLG